MTSPGPALPMIVATAENLKKMVQIFNVIRQQSPFQAAAATTRLRPVCFAS